MPYCYYGRCCLFFCPYRPTTEIYTLSLHDALPISRRASAKRCTAPRSERRTPGRCTSSAATWTGSGGAKPRDRKSTRLNSSHITSSYAVFCLKKKSNTVPTRVGEQNGVSANSINLG